MKFRRRSLIGHTTCLLSIWLSTLSLNAEMTPTPAATNTPMIISQDARGMYRPDNTRANRAGRDEVTPLQQANDPAALKITASIRQDLMNDRSLSMNAENIKIIVDRTGALTLRGPVRSEDERRKVSEIAKRWAEGRKISNELQVIR